MGAKYGLRGTKILVCLIKTALNLFCDVRFIARVQSTNERLNRNTE